MQKDFILSHLRNVPDFPKPGIQFKDVSTLFKDASCLQAIANELYEKYKHRGITKIVGIESRGFVLGAILATRLGAGFVMCRKPGKLPAETISVTYEKEYGHDTLEIHTDSISSDDIVLIHDDLLATGGSMMAVCDMVQRFHPRSIIADCLIELRIEGLKGRELIAPKYEINTMLTIEE